MNIAEFLGRRNLDVAAIVAEVRSSLGLGATDRLLVVGSLAENLGNPKSDVDLILITHGHSNSPQSSVAFIIGSCLIDMELLAASAAEEAFGRLSDWAELSWDISRRAPFGQEDRQLLHRCLHNIPIFEGKDIDADYQSAAKVQLARLKLQIARHMARTIQVDLVGYAEVGDYRSMVFAAQELLGHAADGLMSAYHLTNPSFKWRSRLLERLPATWQRNLGIRPIHVEASKAYWCLHRAPRNVSRTAAVVHASRVASFARAVFAWSEWRLLAGKSQVDPLADWPQPARSESDSKLPCLNFDVDFSGGKDERRLGRINEFDRPIDLSETEFRIALLCDGMTTAREAAIVACHHISAYKRDVVVENFIARLRRAKLLQAEANH
jgi:hypothetical protein